MYMGNIRRTVVPKIQGCIQTEQWLQPVATVLCIFQFYHTLTMAEILQLGPLFAPFIWVLPTLTVPNAVTSLHGV